MSIVKEEVIYLYFEGPFEKNEMDAFTEQLRTELGPGAYVVRWKGRGGGIRTTKCAGPRVAMNKLRAYDRNYRRGLKPEWHDFARFVKVPVVVK